MSDVMRIKYVLLALIIFIVGGVLAYSHLPPGDASLRAARLLSKATEFSLGPTGYAAQRTDAERQFFIILRGRHAADLFRDTYDHGTPEARTYALCGLHLTDKNSCKDYEERFIASNYEVQTVSGCLGRVESVSNLVTAIESGVVERYIPIAREMDEVEKKRK